MKKKLKKYGESFDDNLLKKLTEIRENFEYYLENFYGKFKKKIETFWKTLKVFPDIF